jgi:ATP-dependent Lon protease
VSYEPVDITADIPSIIPILPLRAMVIYPATVVPLAITQSESLQLIDTVLAGDGIVGMVALRDTPAPSESGLLACYDIGTVARVHRLLTLPDGSMRVAVEGLARFTIAETLQTEPFLQAAITLLSDAPSSIDLSTTMAEVRLRTCEFLDLVGADSLDIQMQLQTETNPERLSFLVAQVMMVRQPLTERQETLAIADSAARLHLLLNVTNQELKTAYRVTHPPTTGDYGESFAIGITDLPFPQVSEPPSLDLAVAQAVFAEAIIGYRNICDILIGCLASMALRRAAARPMPRIGLRPLCLVGVHGSGKSTLLQAMAHAGGFSYQLVSADLIHEESAHALLPETTSIEPSLVEIDGIDRLMPAMASALAHLIDQLRDGNTAIANHSQRLLLLAARDVSQIPTALRERVDLVILPELTTTERHTMIRDILVPRFLVMHGLDDADLIVQDTFIEALQAQPTYADLEQLLAHACRNIAVHVLARQQGLETNTSPLVME